MGRYLDLQLFAEKDPDMMDEELEDIADEYEGTEVDDEGTESTEEVEDDVSDSYRTQEEVDAAIERRLARERRKLAKALGVEKVEDASEYIMAGQAVSQAAGVKPGEVVSRLNQRQKGNQQNQTNTQSESALAKELSELREMVEDDYQQKRIREQSEEARKEFGELFDSHREDVVDRAEELGIPLVDAAAIVLRPHLKETVTSRERKKQATRRKRKVEGSQEAPNRGEDVSAKLSPNQKRTAQKMGLSYKEYFAQLKELGETE